MTEQANTNRPVWDSEDQFPALCEQLREGLREITDPEIGLNIIQLGLIRNVKIEPDSATIRVILTTPFCPYGPSLLETTRQKAEEILGRQSFIDLDVGVWDFSMMEEGAVPDWGLY
jgi:metal-sulfur cluster biosynthetic enzyme